jgi:hypothetical protein
MVLTGGVDKRSHPRKPKQCNQLQLHNLKYNPCHLLQIVLVGRAVAKLTS